MVSDELKDEIKRMLKEGYSYRAIREALGVGHWTITRVKQELEREEKERKFMEELALALDEWKREWKRKMRNWLRKEAELTDEKLKALWDYWASMELKNIDLEQLIDRYLKNCVEPLIKLYADLWWNWTAGLPGLLRYNT